MGAGATITGGPTVTTPRGCPTTMGAGTTAQAETLPSTVTASKTLVSDFILVILCTCQTRRPVGAVALRKDLARVPGHTAINASMTCAPTGRFV